MARVRRHRLAALAAMAVLAAPAATALVGCGEEPAPDPGRVVRATFAPERLLSGPRTAATVRIESVGSAGQALGSRTQLLGPRAYTRLKRALAAALAGGSGAGLRPLLDRLRTVGVDAVDGERVAHVRAGLDIDRLIDRVEGADRDAGKLADGGVSVPDRADLSRLKKMVTRASIDIYSSDPDDRLERLELNLVLASGTALPPTHLRIVLAGRG